MTDMAMSERGCLSLIVFAPCGYHQGLHRSPAALARKHRQPFAAAFALDRIGSTTWRKDLRWGRQAEKCPRCMVFFSSTPSGTKDQSQYSGISVWLQVRRNIGRWLELKGAVETQVTCTGFSGAIKVKNTRLGLASLTQRTGQPSSLVMLYDSGPHRG